MMLGQVSNFEHKILEAIQHFEKTIEIDTKLEAAMVFAGKLAKLDPNR